MNSRHQDNPSENEPHFRSYPTEERTPPPREHLAPSSWTLGAQKEQYSIFIHFSFGLRAGLAYHHIRSSKIAVGTHALPIPPKMNELLFYLSTDE